MRELNPEELMQDVKEAVENVLKKHGSNGYNDITLSYYVSALAGAVLIMAPNVEEAKELINKSVTLAFKAKREVDSCKS